MDQDRWQYAERRHLSPLLGDAKAVGQERQFQWELTRSSMRSTGVPWLAQDPSTVDTEGLPGDKVTVARGEEDKGALQVTRETSPGNCLAY